MNVAIAYFATGSILIASLWAGTETNFIIKAIIAEWSVLKLFVGLTMSFLVMTALWPIIFVIILYDLIRDLYK